MITSAIRQKPYRPAPTAAVVTLSEVPSPKRVPSHNLLAVLRQRGFRRLLGVRITSQLADGWFQAGLAGSVLFNPDKQPNPLAIAAGFAVLLLPYSVVGPYIGVFLDRWSRRSILFVANLLRALFVLPTAILIFVGAEGLPFLVLAFLITGLNRFFLAGISAAVPHVVADRQLVTANSLSVTLGSICYSAGLASALGALAHLVPATFHGYGVISSMALIGYTTSAIMARLSFTSDALGPDGPRPEATLGTALKHSGGEMVRGVRHLASRRGAAYAMLAQSAQRMLYGILALATLLLFREPVAAGRDMNGSIPVLAAMFFAAGLGVLAASALTPPIARRITGWRWLATLLAAEGVAIGAFGPTFDVRMLVLAVFVVNLAGQGVKILVETDLQHECADEYRGRVFSLNDAAFNVTFLVGLFVGAFVLPEDGRSASAMIATAALLGLVALWYAMVAVRWARTAGDDIRPSTSGVTAEEASRPVRGYGRPATARSHS